MPVKNVMSPLNSFKCSVYQLVDQNWHKMQSQSTYFVKKFLGGTPQTPMLCLLIVFHTMPFAVTLSYGLIHYYYMPQASKFLSTGIASIPSYKFTIWALSELKMCQKYWRLLKYRWCASNLSHKSALNAVMQPCYITTHICTYLHIFMLVWNIT